MILKVMILFAIAILVLIFYSVFCHAPGEESRKENADRYISCGEIIPEGRWVCPNCERKAKGNEDGSNI